jgi:hypothetical protein
MKFDPSTLLDVSHLAVFLGGTAIGAAGQYFGDRFTDQRRKSEAEAKAKKQLNEVVTQMPAFIAEVRADLAARPELAIREFVVLSTPGVTFNHDRARFEYFESDHIAIHNFVSALVEAGYVEIIRPTGTPIYRFRESFVARLRSGA